MEYKKETIDNLVISLINSIESHESERASNCTDYDNGLLDGAHDAYIDILDLLKIEHPYIRKCQ